MVLGAGCGSPRHVEQGDTIVVGLGLRHDPVLLLVDAATRLLNACMLVRPEQGKIPRQPPSSEAGHPRSMSHEPPKTMVHLASPSNETHVRTLVFNVPVSELVGCPKVP